VLGGVGAGLLGEIHYKLDPFGTAQNPDTIAGDIANADTVFESQVLRRQGRALLNEQVVIRCGNNEHLIHACDANRAFLKLQAEK
jgi:hypothetical protein